MTSTSEALKSIFTAARPLVETWLDTAEQIAALRETATNSGLDWSQVKALLKAQIQDERDDAGDGKRVRKLIDKAEFACAYADILGLGNMNDGKYFAPPHDPETGELTEPAGPALPRPEQQAGAESPGIASAPAVPDEFPDLPDFLRRKKVAA